MRPIWLSLIHIFRQDKNIYMLPSLYDINITKYQMVQFDDTPSFLIKPFHLTAMQRIFKRFCDLLFSTVALLVASPFMLIIALCIKFESKGPVLYTQDRVTQNNLSLIHIFLTGTSCFEKDYLPYPSPFLRRTPI